MFAKLIKPVFGLPGLRCGPVMSLLSPRPSPAGPVRVVGAPPARAVWGVPPNQYDMAIPKKLQFGHVVKEYWELIPVFVSCFVALMVLVFSITWAIRNKVDAVFSTRSRDNISRTMDLRYPSVHKIRLIHQKYEPWPEMQIVLDKMILAEKRQYRRSLSCTHP